MIEEAISRLKRLVSFREHRRDIAGVEVTQSRSTRDRAEAEAGEAEHKAKNELVNTRSQIGKPMYSDQLALNADCAQAAGEELKAKIETLTGAQVELTRKLDCLLAVHRQVKQMETLLESTKERHDREVSQKEQSEIDDLAVIRETRK